MKFIHIADVHLGAAPEAGLAFSKERPQEIWDAFSEVTKRCSREQVDLLLIAGDLFHRQPLMRELKEVSYLFSQMEHTQVVLIAGNHDYLRKDSRYRTFIWPSNVHMLSGENVHHVVLPELDTAVYGLSYQTREMSMPLYDRVKASGYAHYEILLAHGGDDRHIPIHWENLRQSGFDYIALGHIHKQQIFEGGKAAYAGSLEPTDVSDTGKHGFMEGEITERGMTVRFVPVAKREYLHLTVQVDSSMTDYQVCDCVRELIETKGRENIYRFCLRGRRDVDVIFDTERMNPFGNVIEVADETRPAFDFAKLAEMNKDNLIGRYIEGFAGCEEGSVEYQALCEGVEALMRSIS